MAPRRLEGVQFRENRQVVSPGDDLEVIDHATLDKAKAACASNADCIGFTFSTLCGGPLCKSTAVLKRAIFLRRSDNADDLAFTKIDSPQTTTGPPTPEWHPAATGHPLAFLKNVDGTAWLEVFAVIIGVLLLAALVAYVLGKFRTKRRRSEALFVTEHNSRSCVGAVMGSCMGDRQPPDHLVEVPLLPKVPYWWEEIRRHLEGRYDPATIADFQRQYLEDINHWMGHDILVDVDTALLVKVNHSSFLGCCCMTVMTFGLYAFFQPPRDMAILLLTKNGRVILLERLSHSMLGFDPEKGIFSVTLYLLLLIVVTMAPIAMSYVMTKYLEMDYSKVLDLYTPSLAARVETAMAFQWQIYYGIVFCFWLAFVAWVWTHRQRGYGRRFLREFKAKSVAATQYVLEDMGTFSNYCMARGRRSMLRLYFGKYPATEELEKGLPLNAPFGHAAKPMDFSDLDTSDEGGAEGFASASRPSVSGGTDRRELERKVANYFPFLSFVLLTSTFIAEGLKFYSYYEQYQDMKEANGFCKQAATSDRCFEDDCRHWAAGQEINNLKFCSHVTWVHEGGHNPEQRVWEHLGQHTKDVLAHSSPKAVCTVLRVGVGEDRECCAGCVSGHLFEWLGGDDLEKWWENLSNLTSYALLFLALFMSKMAMAYNFSVKKETNCLEIEFLQDVYQAEDDEFYIKEELAMRLVRRVHESAGIHYDATKQHDTIGLGRDGMTKEVRDKDEEGEHFNWPNFLVRRDIVEYEDTTFLTREPHAFWVPRRCLGMSDREKVIEAWTEEAYMSRAESLRVFLVCSLFVALLAFWPKRYGGPRALGWCGNKEDFAETWVIQCKLRRAVKALLLNLVLWAGYCFLKYVFVYAVQKSSVIVTNERIFAIYHRMHPLYFLCPRRCCQLPYTLRVDSFRHGDTTFYGRMTSRTPPWHVRTFSTNPWKAGEVLFKCKYGMLELQRHFGAVKEIYDLVSTILVRQTDAYDFEHAYRRGDVSVNVPVWYGIQESEENQNRFPTVFGKRYPFEIRQPNRDDPYKRKRVAWLADIPENEPWSLREREFLMAPAREERLVYIWSFSETGLLADPYNRYNDVLVTSDRIRFASRSEHKTFDCRTFLCWGFLWCACIKRLFCLEYKPEVRAFLNFSHMEAFSTETSMMPAFCLFRCPCYEALCGMMTALVCCNRQLMSTSIASCWEKPGTSEPMVQLWLRWLQRYAKSSQPDLVLSQRPAQLRKREEAYADSYDRYDRPELEDDLEEYEQGCCARCFPLPVLSKDLPEVGDLRELMRFVLEVEESKLANAGRWF